MKKLPKMPDESPERVEMLAQRVKLLFGFCVELIPDIDLLKQTAATADDRASMALSAAPLLTAAGIDFEDKNFEWGLRARRAEALVNLLKVLDETENERATHKENKERRDQNMSGIARMFNLD